MARWKARSEFLLSVIELLFLSLTVRHYKANCTVLRAIVLTQYRRVTDRQTDGIAVANTTLAMRALQRAVKTSRSRPCKVLVLVSSRAKKQTSQSRLGLVS